MLWVEKLWLSSNSWSGLHLHYRKCYWDTAWYSLMCGPSTDSFSQENVTRCTLNLFHWHFWKLMLLVIVVFSVGNGHGSKEINIAYLCVMAPNWMGSPYNCYIYFKVNPQVVVVWLGFVSLAAEGKCVTSMLDLLPWRQHPGQCVWWCTIALPTVFYLLL